VSSAAAISGFAGRFVLVPFKGRTGAIKARKSASRSKRPAKPEQPYPLPAFAGIFDAPADSSQRAKDVVRGRDATD
jgi:hypothetical protein